MKRIVVIGSSNSDLVIKCERIPEPGETVMGGTFVMNPGGKGANQAVAASRLGGNVIFITKLGDDMFGQMLRQNYMDENLPSDYIICDHDSPTGVALISVDANGENSIVVAPGANNKLSKSDIDKFSDIIKSADFLLIQLEIPIKVVEYAVDLASRNGVKVILNPAPAAELSRELLPKLFLITPNETECKILSGIKVSDDINVERAAEVLIKKGVQNVVVTLGSKGSLIKTETISQFVPARKVAAIDTTAAGDVFNGALCVALAEGREIIKAVEFATIASSISVTRMGAQPSIPQRTEVDALSR